VVRLHAGGISWENSLVVKATDSKSEDLWFKSKFSQNPNKSIASRSNLGLLAIDFFLLKFSTKAEVVRDDRRARV